MSEKEWVLSDNYVIVPEGWYIIPPSMVEEEAESIESKEVSPP